MNRDIDPNLKLHEFLISCFTPFEMRQLLTEIGQEQTLRDVPSGEHIAPNDWFHALIQRLQRHGLIYPDFLAAVANKRLALARQTRELIELYQQKEGIARSSRLPWTDLERLLEAALAAGLGAWEAQFALLDQVDPASCPKLLSRDPTSNLCATLEGLNLVPETVAGGLERWIAAAMQAAGSTAARDVFAWYLRMLRPPLADAVEGEQAASPSPPVRDISEARLRPEVERLVPFSFLKDGQRAGAAVACVRFLSHIDGQPRLSAGARFQGTGVLVAPRLLLTSWYLARANNVSGDMADFLTQCRTATFRFDVDARDPRGGLVLSGGAVAWRSELNLVLLRVEEDLGRTPAILRRTALTPDEPLSVIQHPLAGKKRLGLRELRAYEVSSETLSFVSGDRMAFAGAPWYDDAWQVVGIQGKIKHQELGTPGVRHTATLVTAMIDALERGAFAVPPGGDPAAVWAEIAAAQAALNPG